jgi:hypothetical protein
VVISVGLYRFPHGAVCLDGSRKSHNRWLPTPKIMTTKQILKKLISLHKKFSGSRKSNETSPMCAMWSTMGPPDILEDTPQLDAIEEAVGHRFDEMEAIEFYDMSIVEAAEYIHDIIGRGPTNK